MYTLRTLTQKGQQMRDVKLIKPIRSQMDSDKREAMEFCDRYGCKGFVYELRMFFDWTSIVLILRTMESRGLLAARKEQP